MVGGEVGQCVGQQGTDGTAHAADPQRAQHLVAQVGQVALGGGELGEQPVGVPGQDPAGVGEADAAALRFQETVPGLPLQLGELLRHP